MLDEQLAIAQKNVLLNDSVLRIIHFQFDAGQVSFLAVQQAEAQKLSVAQLVPQFEEDITELRWVAKDEIQDYLKNTFKNIEEIVKKYYDGKSQGN